MNSTPDKILLFGGTFDPIHNAHLQLSQHVAQQLAIPRVILIPSAQPPHKDQASLTPAAFRLEMTRRAVANNPLYHVSDCELHRVGPSYSLLTVNQFQQQYPNAKLFWLLGQDMLNDLVNWYRVSELVELCQIIAVGRPNCPPTDWSALVNQLGREAAQGIRDHVIAAPLSNISATDIRRRVRQRLPIEHLVPQPVLDFIRQNKLYR